MRLFNEILEKMFNTASEECTMEQYEETLNQVDNLAFNDNLEHSNKFMAFVSKNNMELVGNYIIIAKKYGDLVRKRIESGDAGNMAKKEALYYQHALQIFANAIRKSKIDEDGLKKNDVQLDESGVKALFFHIKYTCSLDIIQGAITLATRFYKIIAEEREKLPELSDKEAQTLLNKQNSCLNNACLPYSIIRRYNRLIQESNFRNYTIYINPMIYYGMLRLCAEKANLLHDWHKKLNLKGEGLYDIMISCDKLIKAIFLDIEENKMFIKSNREYLEDTFCIFFNLPNISASEILVGYKAAERELGQDAAKKFVHLLIKAFLYSKTYEDETALSNQLKSLNISDTVKSIIDKIDAKMWGDQWQTQPIYFLPETILKASDQNTKIEAYNMAKEVGALTEQNNWGSKERDLAIDILLSVIDSVKDQTIIKEAQEKIKNFKGQKFEFLQRCRSPLRSNTESKGYATVTTQR